MIVSSEKKKKSELTSCFTVVVILNLIAVFVCCVAPYVYNPKDANTIPTKTPVQQQDAEQEPQQERDPITVYTDNHGVYTVPGPAFLDGRDSQINPPLTIMEIGIWDTMDHGVLICQLEHGTRVELISARRNELDERYYFQIKSNDCTGWVSELFLDTEYREPIGNALYIQSSTLSPEESQYIARVKELIISYSTALTTISNLSYEASGNIALFLDDDWKRKIAFPVILLKLNYDVIVEMTPPARFGDIHTDLLQAASSFSAAADLLAEGIGELDADKIELATERIKFGSELIVGITEEISEMSDQ